MIVNPYTRASYDLFHRGTLAFARAERQGIRVDLEYVERKLNFLTRKIERLDSKFRDTSFCRHWEHAMQKRPNIYSNSQLTTYLYKIKGLTPTKTTASGEGATDEEALTSLGIPELETLIQIRKLKKARDTYLEAYTREQVKGYIHPTFNLHLVRSFRSSSDRPNFQNIPKRDKEVMTLVRKALYPRPGHQLLEVDYSGIEVRVAACYHQDKTMLKYINDPTTDMHGDMAKQIFMIDKFDKSIPEHKVLRAAAKNGFVFPQFYGDYYKNCAENLSVTWGQLNTKKWEPGMGIPMPEGTLADHMIRKGIKSYQQFEDHIKEIEKDFWESRFPEYARWKKKWWRAYQRNGYMDSLTGFRYSGEMGKNDVINYPVQGSAFHCLLWAFIELDRISIEENWDTKLIGQIHDAIIFDVHPDELEKVTRTIHRVTCEDLPKAWPWIITPLEVEMDLAGVDCSWADVEAFKL